MPNPLIAQGSLNRLRASVVWNSFPTLTVTAPYLAAEGIKLSLQGESVLYLNTLTGAVTSQQPYMIAEMEIALIKSQSLANSYKQQMETNAILGDGSVRPDSVTLGIYQLTNCSIKSIRPLDFSGTRPDFTVTIGGYYLINSNLYG